MKTEYDFEEFIKNFYNNEQLKGFILRVRDNKDKDENDSEEGKASNIAYYNGIKAFDIINNNNKAKLEFPVNVYKCNTTDVRKIKKLGDKELEEYKSSKISLLNEMSAFATFSFEKITFELNEKSKNKEKYKQVMDDFKKFVESKHYTFSIDKGKKNIIKFNPNIINPKDIVEIQCKYIELFKYDKSSQTITKGDDYNIKISLSKNINFSTFISKIKAGISNYKSSDKLEKKYQHYFMLNASESKDLFPCEEDEFITHFEQEYGIINHNPIIGEINEKGYKTGRIDCIFYKYKKITEKKFNVSDIYLIEIKVDNTVILGNNGVMTHLEDIKAFLNYENNKKPLKYDVETLKKRIKYRNEVLFDSDETEFNNTKIHFYTVVGFTNDDEIEIVSNNIKGLSNEKFVENKYPNKNVTLYSIAPDKSQCDIKFFYEKSLFTPKLEKISTNFEDVTEELAPGFIQH